MEKEESPGVKYLNEDIYDSFGRLLLAKGMPLTANIVETLANRSLSQYRKNSTPERGPQAKHFDLSLKKHFEALYKYREFIIENGQIKAPYIQFGTQLTEVALKNIIKQDSLMNSLLSALYTHLPPVYTHIVRVTFLSAMIAANYGQLEANLNDVVTSALFHDIGRLMVPSFVNTANKISAEDLQTVKNHSAIGSYFLSNVGFPDYVCKSALQHHESFNGGGYPRALSGSEIHLYAQIIRLADVFDALTSLQAYQNPEGLAKATEIIIQRKNTDFSAHLVDSFISLMDLSSIPFRHNP